MSDMVVKAGLATTDGWYLKAAAITSNSTTVKLAKEIATEVLDEARPPQKKLFPTS
jgi:hypothetical protein